MADVLFVLIVLAFFGLMVLLVKACDAIIGPDEPVAAPRADSDTTDSAGSAGPAAAQEVVS